MVPDGQKDGRTDAAKTISLRLRRGIKSINHASKYRIYERYRYFGAHFMEIQCFAMKKMLKIS